MTEYNADPFNEVDILQNNDVLYRVASFHYHETLANLMEKEVFMCRPEDTVQAVAQEMARRKVSSVVVTDEGAHPLGIVTERDLVRKVVAECVENTSEKKISDIMTHYPVCLSPGDSLFDSLSTFLRHTIKHVPIIQNNKVVGIITLRQIMKIRYAEPFVIIGELDQAQSVADMKKIRDDLIYLVQEKLSSRIDPVDVLTMISLVNFDIQKRLLQKVIREHAGEPPADFCFFVTGSHGRKENLLFPDQDFCLIIEDYDDAYYNEYDNYFYEISKEFSDALKEAGFSYCPGNIMAQNPTWRKRISEWLLHVSHIFLRQGRFTVRYMTLIFDSAPLYGNAALYDRYMNHAFEELSKNQNVLRQMHEEEEGRHRVPLGLFHSFITEKGGPHKKEIDMKRSGLLFIIESARLLAMKHGIRETSTLGRLQALVEKGVIQGDDSEYFENAYRVILHHTLMAQADNYLHKGSADYFLNPYELSDRSQGILKNAFKAISRLQDIVGSEFGELIL
jgi:CBS domain-containing protein